MSTIPARVIATSFSLVAFALCLIAGTYAGNDYATVLSRSIMVMMLTWIVGRIIGTVMQATVEDYINRYKVAKPVPVVELLSDDSADSEYAKMGEEVTVDVDEENQRLSNDDIDIEELLNAA
ncbi:hypothetical protein [Poriferisphaera corsica]|uniref:hypothetical protein n=1 Tax=Poriferisphaera corsica TaxID=2528020 RepID=UPI0011A28F5F|nr:hypothetical protein [Poriferisphaera corsica]